MSELFSPKITLSINAQTSKARGDFFMYLMLSALENLKTQMATAIENNKMAVGAKESDIAVYADQANATRADADGNWWNAVVGGTVQLGFEIGPYRLSKQINKLQDQIDNIDKFTGAAEMKNPSVTAGEKTPQLKELSADERKAVDDVIGKKREIFENPDKAVKVGHDAQNYQKEKAVEAAKSLRKDLVREQNRAESLRSQWVTRSQTANSVVSSVIKSKFSSQSAEWQDGQGQANATNTLQQNMLQNFESIRKTASDAYDAEVQAAIQGYKNLGDAIAAQYSMIRG